jgi:ubiquinone/menaquinone biosynthesis C-methylase UbiE
MKGNYDNVASFYDKLSSLVFGNAIIEAQKFLIDAIYAGGKLLIVGGGSGLILEEICKKHKRGLSITYVEVSAKMVMFAKQRDCCGNTVFFINEPIQDAPITNLFDIIITPFVFDNFSNETTKVVFEKLNQHLKNGGFWLFADFQLNDNSNYWQKPLLKLMYTFFRLTCKVEATTLPDTASLFSGHGYKKISSRGFFKNFISAIIYQKPTV